MFTCIYNTLPYLTPEVLNTFFHAVIYLLLYIVNINQKFYYEKSVQLPFSTSAMSLMRTFAASAASRFGRKAGFNVSGFNFVLLSFPKLQLSSSGYRCCTGLSSQFLPARSLTARTTSSLPDISSSKIPNFH